MNKMSNELLAAPFTCKKLNNDIFPKFRRQTEGLSSLIMTSIVRNKTKGTILQTYTPTN